MQLIIVPAVIELLLDPAAYLEPQIGRNGDVSGIEEAVDAAAEQETVACLVLATIAIGTDVNGLEGWKGAFLGDDATAVVGIGDEDVKGALAEARVDGVARLSWQSACAALRIQFGILRPG